MVSQVFALENLEGIRRDEPWVDRRKNMVFLGKP